MRIKELFTVPEGKRVTEKIFGRVLISSVCSILLCTACLAGTTWAWFTVSVENTGNVIQIGEPVVTVTVNDGNVEIENKNNADYFNKKATLYVTLSFDNEVAGYVVLDDSNGYKAVLVGSIGDDVQVSGVASWFAPAGTTELTNEITWLNEVPATEDADATESVPTTAPTTEPATEPTAAATTPTEETTEAADPTEDSTTATDSTEETMDAANPASEPTTTTDPSADF